jgi:hypothetical protein
MVRVTPVPQVHRAIDLYIYSCTLGKVTARRIGISEARRLLPQLVKSVAREGGRIDITCRGEAQVCLLRVSDVKRARTLGPDVKAIPTALQVDFVVPSADLVEVIRDLRSRQGHPRTGWLASPAGGASKRKPSRRKPRAS